jgi:putative toxin-antitoxin system antitoxin component (TIGR02293 family)
MAILVPAATKSVTPKVAMKALGRLAERWKLKRNDIPQLLARPDRTVRRWFERDGGTLDPDVLERISHLVGIYDGLHRLFGDAAYADRWVHEPNAAFRNRRPLELLRSGSFTTLVQVRRYIEQALLL